MFPSHLQRRLGLVLFCASLAVPALGQEAIAWRADHEIAMAEARASRQPIMVDLWATWCAPCKVMEQVVYPDARVVTASKAVVMVKVDVDKHPEVAEKYGPDGIPTLVFVDPFGNEIVRREGMVDAARLVTLLGQLPASYADAPPVFETLSQHANDHASLMAVGDYYVSKQAHSAALLYYERASGTPLAARDAGARCDTALKIGTTLLKLDAAPMAEQAFRDALKSRDRTREPMLRLGLASAQLAQGQSRSARRTLADLAKRYPDTDAGREAAARLRTLAASHNVK